MILNQESPQSESTPRRLTITCDFILETFAVFFSSIVLTFFSNLFPGELAKFVEGQTGKPCLLDKLGYPFTSNKKRGTKIYWTCRNYWSRDRNNKCYVRAVTDGDYVIQWTGVHNH